MIRIYVDDHEGVELVVRDKGVDLSTTPIYFATLEPPARSASTRGMRLPWVALLVVASLSGGYIASSYDHRAHAATEPAELPRPTPPNVGLPPGGSADGATYIPPQPELPNSGAEAVTNALASAPSITPPPGPSRPANPPGTAAFGLQP
jgi:hypothetical protein